MRSIWLIAKSVLIEAIRRREIYAIVLISVILIGAVMTVDFFHLEGIEKFYREVALKVMSLATALTVIVLSARQLPREFETRTIYPLMAKPISRSTFLLGKLLGVLLAASFCFAMFMLVYLCGTLYLKGTIPWVLFGQYIYLQLLMMLIISTLSFFLSMIMNLDAAITISSLLYISATTLSSLITYIYQDLEPIGQKVMLALVYLIPQLTLFDLSEKAVHASTWHPVEGAIIFQLTIYALIYSGIYFILALMSFRRRAL